MSGRRFFRLIRKSLGPGLLVLAGLAACAVAPYLELTREFAYRDLYGGGWKDQYEEHFGSLTDARLRVAVIVLGIVIVLSILTVLVMYLRRKPYESRGRENTRRPMQGSSIEKIVRWHRNALLGIYLGAAGIMAGILLVVFRWDIFADHADEVALGITVFLFGYSGVIAGCWWWLRAKAWMEAGVLIAFMPLAVFFVPYARLIFVAMPAIVMLATAAVPLVLVVVVFALPDRSGSNRRQTLHNWSGAAGER
ncbi:MAG TPA: hypothetical protein VN048_15115 [Verrucomicrobiae bacterium]|jgi:hypothetical protein|nr:hypothetical protein [Verrucomicrobiae bacterium]